MYGISVPLSILFFLDQGFCSIVTNGLKNKLQKPGGYHFDLFLVGVINIIMSLMGLPWLHLALPHSDFHVRKLAIIKESKSGGSIRETILAKSVIEQRVTAFTAHILIFMMLFPFFDTIITKIPLPIMSGIFLFLAFSSLYLGGVEIMVLVI